MQLNTQSKTASKYNQHIRLLAAAVPSAITNLRSGYYLFSSMGHALTEQHFDSYEESENLVTKWFVSKLDKFYWRGTHKLLER